MPHKVIKRRESKERRGNDMDESGPLTSRVMVGIICGVEIPDIRAQLKSEGIDPNKVESALTRGMTQARIRLGWK